VTPSSSRILAAAFATCFTLHAVDAAAQAKTTLVIKEGQPLDGKINGNPVRFKMKANGIAYPILNPDVASRLKLRSNIFSVVAVIGPVKVPGKTGVAKIEASGSSFKHRILWFERPTTTQASATLSPESVPQQVIRFELREPVAGEKLTRMPLVRKDFTLNVVQTAGGQDIFVQFDPDLAKSMATAGAANVIGGEHGGQLSGATYSTPYYFGVERPLRTVQLATPFRIGPLSLSSFSARVSDLGAISNLPDADLDPNEVLVTASRSKVKPIYRIILGADALENCSSITFDKPRKVIELSCR
jgi:hypothetical protein